MKQLPLYRIALLLLFLSGCGSSKQVADFSSVQVAQAEPVKVDTTRAKHTDTSVIQLPNGTVEVTPPVRTKAGKIISSITGRDRVSIKNGAVVLPRKNKGSISINIGSGSATAAVTGKKSDAAVGDGATSTNIGKVKAPLAVGEGIQQHTAAKNGVVGDNNQINKAKGSNTWLWIIGGLAAAYGIWYVIAGGLVGFFARSNWKLLAGIFVALGAVLLYLFK
jgi:PBP1b-binding outer membrane lipoprotein LpoB